MKLVREAETIVIKRENARGLLYAILRKSVKTTINQDCRFHLHEMDISPDYYPDNVDMAKLWLGCLGR